MFWNLSPEKFLCTCAWRGSPSAPMGMVLGMDAGDASCVLASY